jgi:hypothetical protein
MRTILLTAIFSARAANRMALWAWALCVAESLKGVRLQRRECDAPSAWDSCWDKGIHWAEIF